MLIVEGHRRDGGERDSLVCRAEEHVVLDAGLDDGGGVVLAELRELLARVEETCVEEVGAGTARLEREVAEAEHFRVDAELQELRLPRWGCHGRCLEAPNFVATLPVLRIP